MSQNRQNPVHVAYKAADEADAAYSAIIRQLYGPRATRWTLNGEQSMDRRIIDAFRAKLDADEAFLVAFRAARTEQNPDSR